MRKTEFYIKIERQKPQEDIYMHFRRLNKKTVRILNLNVLRVKIRSTQKTAQFIRTLRMTYKVKLCRREDITPDNHRH